MDKSLPLWSPRFVYEDGQLKYKPFPRYPSWLVAWDISDTFVDIDADIAAAAAAAAAAQTTADTAVTNAATAQSTANTAVTNAATAQTTANNAQAAASSAAIYPTTYFINPRSMKVNSGGFGAFAVATTDVFNGLYIMTGLSSEVEVKFPMAAGNWKFMIVGLKYNGAGKITLYLDNNIVSEIDFYNATVLRNQEVVWSLNSVAIGLHTFHVKITDKNASGAYNLACNYMSLWKV